MANRVDPELEALIRRTYERFNARDVDAVLALMHPDVDWPNAIDDTRLTGHDAIREYWTWQFERFDPRVTPIGFESLDAGLVRVRVSQELYDLEGDLVGQGEVFHDYAFRDGLIERMDIVSAEP
jgi:hypothetical protein